MLLVTNQLQYAPEANSILYLEDGEMAAYGNFDEVAQNEGFAALLNEYEARHTLQAPKKSRATTGGKNMLMKRGMMAPLRRRLGSSWVCACHSLCPSAEYTWRCHRLQSERTGTVKTREARTRTSMLRRRKHTSCMQPPAAACRPLRCDTLEIIAVCLSR